MKKNKQIKVLHLPYVIGGNAWGLSQAEKLLDMDSKVLVRGGNPFNYKYDYRVELETILSKREKILKYAKLFLSIRNKYDIFHFNFGSTLFSEWQHADGNLHPWLLHLELSLYPKKSKLFVTYNGCDAKQKYPTMWRRKYSCCHMENCYGGSCNSGIRDVNRAQAIKILSKYVYHMWAVNPDLLHFLPEEKSSFLPYTIHDFNQKVSLPKLEKKIKIIHAPTNRAFKGSVFVIEAIEKLKIKYQNLFDFIMVENKSNQEALEIYQSADLIIDQLLAGWYGAFTIEAMLMGKPVIARIEKEDLKFIPNEMINDLLNSIIDADPENIYEILEKCINDRQFLKEKSQASLEYAKKWHHPEYVASLVKEKYEQALSQ